MRCAATRAAADLPVLLHEPAVGQTICLYAPPPHTGVQLEIKYSFFAVIRDVKPSGPVQRKRASCLP
jgi:hypothetical protein